MPMSLLSFPHLTSRVWTVWSRNRDVFLKTFRVNFLPPLVEPILYLLALGFGLGTYIETVDGMPYAEFLAPALVAISIMYSGFFETTYGSYVRMYYQKSFDAIIATPISIEEVIAGEILWGATRSLINATIMLPVLLVFGVVDLPSSLLIVPFSFFGGFLFATIGMCFTAITPHIDTLNLPTFLFITPMFLFSGTFFPLSLLPQALQYIALAVLPLAHVVIVSRALATGQFSLLAGGSFLWICFWSLVLFVLAINLMRRRLII